VKLFVFTILIAGVALAQSFQGSLRSRIVDPNKAAIPRIKLTITDSQHYLHQSDFWSDYQPGEHASDAAAWSESNFLRGRT
jgi:hypothetical protein